MFERFTEAAIKCIIAAQDEARQISCHRVGTEHILLGLLMTGEIAQSRLESYGVDLGRVREEVEKQCRKESGTYPLEVPFTNRAKVCLENAWNASKELGASYIGTEHILVGLVSTEGCNALKILKKLNIAVADLRMKIKDPRFRADDSSYLAKLIAIKKGELRSAEMWLREWEEMRSQLPDDQKLIDYAVQQYERQKSEISEISEEVNRLMAQIGQLQVGESESMLSQCDKIGSKNLMSNAQEESRRLGHNFVGSEQMLVAIFCDTGSISSECLRSLGLTLEKLRLETEKIIGRGRGFCSLEIPFTPRAKRILELSFEEARSYGLSQIESTCLLLGILREREGVASRVLENLKVDRRSLESSLRRGLSERSKPDV